MCVPELISSYRFEAQKLLLQVSLREMMLAVPLLFLPAISAFKTGNKPFSKICLFFKNALSSHELPGLEDGLICNVCVGTHPGCGLYDFDYRYFTLS